MQVPDHTTLIYQEMRPKQYAIGAIHSLLMSVPQSKLTRRERDILAIVITAQSSPARLHRREGD